MKINLLVNSNNTRQSHVNIDPFANPQDPTKIKCNVDNLDIYADDGEITDLIAIDVIDYIPLPQKEQVMDHWLKKVAKGGTIKIGGTDIFQATRAIYHRHIDLLAANKVLYGENVPKFGLVNIGQMIQILEMRGFKILEKKLIDLQYFVKAERQ